MLLVSGVLLASSSELVMVIAREKVRVQMRIQRVTLLKRLQQSLQINVGHGTIVGKKDPVTTATERGM